MEGFTKKADIGPGSEAADEGVFVGSIPNREWLTRARSVC
jgi:hypothetical protein